MTTTPSINKILVPVDFSPCSEAALNYACFIAGRFGAKVHLLHVWEAPAFLPPETIVGSPETGRTLAALAHQQAFELITDMARSARDRGFEIAGQDVAFGAPARTIVGHAEENGHDLIVMGTHGRTGLMHVLLGSVAEKVVNFAKCPVLTVREPAGE
ncbi:MAG TPA: universal stress protein [Polyangiaceae bacterium]|jgi:nucleotide-binding universal stress UspA family protein